MYLNVKNSCFFFHGTLVAFQISFSFPHLEQKRKNDDSLSAEQIKAQNKYGWLGLEYIFNKNDRLHKDYNALAAVPHVIENHCRELAGLILKVTGKEKFILFTIAQDKYVTREIINQKM